MPATMTATTTTIGDVVREVVADRRDQQLQVWKDYCAVLHADEPPANAKEIIGRVLRELKVTGSNVIEHAAVVGELRAGRSGEPRALWILNSFPWLFDESIYPPFVGGAIDHWIAAVEDATRARDRADRAGVEASQVEGQIASCENNLHHGQLAHASPEQRAGVQQSVQELRDQLPGLRQVAATRGAADQLLELAQLILKQAQLVGA